MSCDGWAALPRCATGLSAVCDCGISWSNSLTIFVFVVFFKRITAALLLFLFMCGVGVLEVGLLFIYELSMLVEHNSFFKQRQNCKHHDPFILKAPCLHVCSRFSNDFISCLSYVLINHVFQLPKSLFLLTFMARLARVLSLKKTSKHLTSQ